MRAEYETVTEVPGLQASRLQLSMFYTRYRYAAQFSKDKDVLELACGAGQGLGYLARSARRVVGSDIDEKVLSFAREHYQGRANIELLLMDAEELQFPDASFDVVILYEAIYYLPNPARFAREAARVLRPGGVVIVCSVNREWSDWGPSPFSTAYPSAAELSDLLCSAGLATQILGAFPVAEGGVGSKMVSGLKRLAVALHVMPRTMRGKQLLKRLVFGKLAPLPSEVTDEMGAYLPPTPMEPAAPSGRYRVIYAVGTAPS